MPISDNEFERTIVSRPGRTDEAAAAPEVIGHYLTGGKEGEPVMRVEIGAQPITIGRGAGQTLVLADGDVSRLHARVVLARGEAVVEDLGSTNGTFVDGQRIVGPTPLKEDNVLRLGSHVFRYERRSRRDVEQAKGLDKELRRASNYVLSLLPAPLTDGPVLTEWRFVPSTQLGGDAFGYFWLDPDTFVFYLLDVSGHGAGSAMHSVTVLNVLRQRALPGVDFQNPAEVLASLNARFPMDGHGGLYFTMWYGLYRVGDRMLTYSSAGHHPSSLVTADRAASTEIGMPATMIGMLPGIEYENAQARVPPGSRLFLFSDGVFEVMTAEQERWSLTDFQATLLEPMVSGMAESERLYQRVKQVAAPGPLEDDFSLLVVTFP